MGWLDLAPDLKQLVTDVQANLGAPPWALVILALLGLTQVGLLFIVWRQAAGLSRAVKLQALVSSRLCDLQDNTVDRMCVLRERADEE